MKVEFAGTYSDKSISLYQSRHFIDTAIVDDSGEVIGVREASDPVAEYYIKQTATGSNYQTFSNVVDNAYPAPMTGIADHTQVYKNYYVNGEGAVDVVEQLAIQGNAVIVDYVPPTVNRVEYINESHDTVIKIYSDDHPSLPETSSGTMGESNYYRTYTLIIDSTDHPEDTDPDTLVQVHTLYGHLNHPLNESINHRNHRDIVSATLLDQVFNTFDTEVVGGCLISSDLSRYYLGNRIILPDAEILQTSDCEMTVDEEGNPIGRPKDTIPLNLGRFNISTGQPEEVGDACSHLKLSSTGEDFAPPVKGYLFSYPSNTDDSETQTRYYYFLSSYLGTSTKTVKDLNYDPFPPESETDENGVTSDYNFIMGTARETSPDGSTRELVKVSAAYSTETPTVGDNSLFTDYHDLILYPYNSDSIDSGSNMNNFPDL